MYIQLLEYGIHFSAKNWYNRAGRMSCVKVTVSRRQQERADERARLDAVWYVDADASYSVDRRSMDVAGYALVRTLTGLGRLRLRSGADYELRPNSIAVYRIPDIAHYEAGEAGWQFYWFEYESARAPDMLMQVCELRLSAQERIELERCMTSLAGASARESELADALFEYLLADWRLRFEGVKRGGTPARELAALLEKGRRERLTIAQLARSAGMCERSFRDAVRASTGMSPKAYMLRGEMTAAMELMRTSGMTISEIAACFNYSNQFYFSRVFKKYYGVPPQRVRDSLEL